MDVLKWFFSAGAGRRIGANQPTTVLFLMGFFLIAWTGAPWRDLPTEFGKWSSVYRQFWRWTLAGLWEQIMDRLNDSNAVLHALQMIDSTVVRTNH